MNHWWWSFYECQTVSFPCEIVLVLCVKVTFTSIPHSFLNSEVASYCTFKFVTYTVTPTCVIRSTLHENMFISSTVISDSLHIVLTVILSNPFIAYLSVRITQCYWSSDFKFLTIKLIVSSIIFIVRFPYLITAKPNNTNF